MVVDQGKEGTRILVDLGGVKLPAAMEKQLEAEIRRAVLGALSGIDLPVDLTLVSRPKLPKGTIGIILRPA
jgi:hypothetical protein